MAAEQARQAGMTTAHRRPRQVAAAEGVHYQVVDAKRARSAKAGAVLQTAFYSHLLADVQGIG